MIYILMFIGLNQTPAQLGSYQSLSDCDRAIRSIYEQQMTPAGMIKTDQSLAAVKQAVDIKMQYQREYRCFPKEK